ncbi:MAG: Rrf2 family transcriptional regulator [Acidimicrobiales bacterium]|nr:Rrf2 family transcriptional regulator [Acidimicrobiales bacterium]
MYISARSDYALRALVTLGAARKPMTAEELATSQELPVNYLEAILLDLRRGGLVASRRGPEAGYRFLRPPEELTPADVMRVLEGPLAEVRGLRPEAIVYKEPAEPLQELWVALRASIRRVLEGVTIAQLAQGRLPRELSRLLSDPDAWLPR